MVYKICRHFIGRVDKIPEQLETFELSFSLLLELPSCKEETFHTKHKDTGCQDNAKGGWHFLQEVIWVGAISFACEMQEDHVEEVYSSRQNAG